MRKARHSALTAEAPVFRHGEYVTDKRYQRTRRLLRESLLALIEEKPFHAITVSAIAERADVARKTFYEHVANKYDLLWECLEPQFDALAADEAQLDPESLLRGGKPLSYPLFAHVQRYPLLYRSLLGEEGDGVFMRRLWRYIARQSYEKHQPLRDAARIQTVPPELQAELLAGAALGAVRWWLAHDLTGTPEEMAYRFSQIVAPGVLQAWGLD
ncbi:MAG: TetR/AcrR family transcriptional regulator [Anaerolineae bacterium]